MFRKSAARRLQMGVLLVIDQILYDRLESKDISDE